MLRGFRWGFVNGAGFSLSGLALLELWLRRRKQQRADATQGPPPDGGGSPLERWGLPDRGANPRVYAHHALSYDQARRGPAWVAEHLTLASFSGDANRKHCHFRPDPGIEARFSASDSDFRDSGWSRGHMAPSEDNKFSQEAMNQTFYFSNIVPQDISNNEGIWRSLESLCEQLTALYADVWVVTGPLALAQDSDAGSGGGQRKGHVSYEVIGANEVAVPTHLYKVIVAQGTTGGDGGGGGADRGTEDGGGAEDSGGATAEGATAEGATAEGAVLAAFVIPNAPVPQGTPLGSFQVQLEQLERWAGITFFPRLDRQSCRDLCRVESCGGVVGGGGTKAEMHTGPASVGGGARHGA
ncbi:nuclease EXOG, mitochondrial-like isoform X2 [Petromyzon marinus]|uniref:nuclease EXOG, mitochondrial-like isoform X2 n=1 Tax=Petromyzon marinus TaxID=7757 RepID=UPI003F71C66C